WESVTWTVEFTTKLAVGPPMPPTTTPTGPVTAPGGTVATIWVSLQLTTGALIPAALGPSQNWTTLLDWVAPKPVPEMVTVPFTAAAPGKIASTAGAPSTANGKALLVSLYLTTVILPDAAFDGT